MAKELIAIEEVAKVVGMSVASINYYSNLGILEPASRKGNKRLYDKAECVAKFQKIKDLRKKGFSLKLIQQQFLLGE